VRKIGINLAEVDATKIVEDSNEFLVVPAIIAREGVFPYPEGKAFKPAQELKEAAWTAEGAWIVAEKHPDTVILTVRDDIKGKVENTKFCDKVNGILGNLRFFKAKCDSTFLDEIKTGKRKDVSLGFFYDFDGTPGKWNDQTYDFVQRNILVDHVAAGVPVGRCRSPYCGIAVDQMIRKPSLFPLLEIQGANAKELKELMDSQPFKNLRSSTFFFPKVAVDPEETENYIHIPVRDASDFVDDSFRTIDIDADKGIKAVIGKLKSDPKGSTHIQKYLFDKGKDWTMERAQAWVKEHKKAADSADGLSVEEIKAKITQLNQDRQKIIDKLYPKSSLTEEEQQKLRSDLDFLDAQLRAFENALGEKIAAGADQEGDLEKRRQEAKQRCARTSITFKEDKGHLTKPEEYANVPEDDFADPCNFNYPMVPEDRLRAAWQRLHQEENREAGGYSEAEWTWMQNRVKKRMESKGIEVQADAVEEIERARRLLES
jgi:hypothetical protein